MSSDNVYYVYLHRRGDNNEIFYVGKGKNKRAFDVKQRNPYWTNIYNKHGRTVEYVQKDLSEDAAYSLEERLIKYYRESGYNLANITDGGKKKPMEYRNKWSLPPVQRQNNWQVVFSIEQSSEYSVKTKLPSIRVKVNGCCIAFASYKERNLAKHIAEYPNGELGQIILAQMISQGFNEKDFNYIFTENQPRTFKSSS